MDFSALMICGSLQARSANRSALAVARRYLERIDGVVVREFEGLADLPILNPDEPDGNAAVARLREQIGASDGVLVASPEYGGAIAGGIKNALDWIVGSGELYGKPVVAISAGTSGGWYANQHLIQSLSWRGAIPVDRIGIATPRTKMDSEGRFVDADTIADIERGARRLLESKSMPRAELIARAREVVRAAGVEEAHLDGQA
jgi:NAD(P)H-dependent FMN reductase